MKLSYVFLTVLFISLFAGTSLRAGTLAGENIGVFGDSLGDGVWSGLYSEAKKHPGDKIFRHTKVGSGLTRSNFAGWVSEVSSQLDSDKINVAVVFFGENDQQGIRDENHKGHVFKSEGWKRAYSARIDTLFSEFEKRRITVIWLGLPSMRSKEINEGAVFMNALFADKIKRHKGVFIPLMNDFKGKDGEFTTHYIDAKGKSHLLRAEDGVHFTGYGYELIAEKVYTALSAKQSAVVLPVATPAPIPAPVAAPTSAPQGLPAPVSLATPATTPAPMAAPAAPSVAVPTVPATVPASAPIAQPQPAAPANP